MLDTHGYPSQLYRGNSGSKGYLGVDWNDFAEDVEAASAKRGLMRNLAFNSMILPWKNMKHALLEEYRFENHDRPILPP